MKLREDPEPRGPQFILQLVMAQLDPGQEPPPMPPGKTPREGETPREISQLHRQMAVRTAESIHRKFNEIVNRRFTLGEAQLSTLHSLDIPEEQAQRVESLNCLQMLPQNHAINKRLEVIATIPPARPGETTPPSSTAERCTFVCSPGGCALRFGAPSGAPPHVRGARRHHSPWKEWWLRNRNQRIGVVRPQDHDPEQDPISEDLNQVICAMLQKALQDQPSRVEIAQDILQETQPREASAKGGRETSAKGGRESAPSLSLTRAWAGIRNLQDLARRLGAEPRQLLAQDPISAEHLAQELRDAGITVIPDMGSIGTPWEIREALLAAGRPASTREINTSCAGQHWYWKEAPESSQIDPRNAIGGDGKRVRGTTENLSPEERNLLGRTAPEHPGILGDLSNAPNPSAATIAFLNRMTPLGVEEIIDRGSTTPPTVPPPCPRTRECSSWCAHLQEQDLLPFPLTHDGIYQNCRYWQFLEQFGAMDPANRAPFAQHTQEETGREQSRARHQRNREQARPEPETPDQTPKTQSNQAKLF